MNNVLALSQVVIKELIRRKDFYVLFVMTAVMMLLLASVNFFNEPAISGIIKEASLLLIWISSFVMAITTAARQIPSERESRTIFPLLAKPVSRAELIGGKFLGCWLACGICLTVFYLFFAVVIGTREQGWPLMMYFQALWLHWILLAVVVSMSLLGSIVFAAPSSNSTIVSVIVLGIWLLGQYLNRVALKLAEPLSTIVYSIYFAIPHFEFFDVRDKVIHKLGLVPWDVFFLATLYGAAYAIMFVTATWLLFRRKSLG
jgi:ABC-type transport system involved in multi-copper enzyme maturation permease subunit